MQLSWMVSSHLTFLAALWTEHESFILTLCWMSFFLSLNLSLVVILSIMPSIYDRGTLDFSGKTVTWCMLGVLSVNYRMAPLLFFVVILFGWFLLLSSSCKNFNPYRSCLVRNGRDISHPMGVLQESHDLWDSPKNISLKSGPLNFFSLNTP